MQRIAAAAMVPSGVPPVPISRSVPDSGARHGDGPGAVGDQPDPGAGLANLRDQLSVPGATQNTPSDRGRCPHSGFTEIFLL